MAGRIHGQIRRYLANTIETTRLAIAAREHLFGWAGREGIDFDLERRGILHLYHDHRSFESVRQTNDLLREGGPDRYPVTSDEITRTEPAIHGNFFTPSDATGDIHKFTRRLAAACSRKSASLRLDRKRSSRPRMGAIAFTR